MTLKDWRKFASSFGIDLAKDRKADYTAHIDVSNFDKIRTVVTLAGHDADATVKLQGSNDGEHFEDIDEPLKKHCATCDHDVPDKVYCKIGSKRDGHGYGFCRSQGYVHWKPKEIKNCSNCFSYGDNIIGLCKRGIHNDFSVRWKESDCNPNYKFWTKKGE